jgi:hypothetical protein
MERVHFTLSFLALILVGSLAALSCGTSQSQLQAIAISPSAADAQDFPNGQVQFTATGFYAHPTHTVTPQSANWVACQQDVPTTLVTVSASGVAQCASGATGQYSINAWDFPSQYTCLAMNACGGGCTIEATAQLTCP